MNLVKLGTILHMEKGRKPVFQSKEPSEGLLPYVDIKTFEQGIIDNYATTDKVLLCEDGDLLIVCDGSRSGLTGRAIKGVVGSTLSKIRADGITTEYLQYFIQSKYILLNTKIKGTGTPHLNVDILKAAWLIIPSLSEQQRIVTRIDELFSELNKAIEILQTIKQQLAIYRQAVLKEAFEAKTSYKHVILSEIAEIVGGVTKGRNLRGLETIELPYLRVANVQDGYLDLNTIKTIEIKLSEREKYLLKQGDVLYTEGGDRDKLGRGTVWNEEISECIHQNHIFRARIDRKKANPKYIALFSQSIMAKDYFFQKGKQTTNLASINMTILKALPVPLPSLIEQMKILELAESQLSICSKIEQIIDENLAKAQAFRQSILKNTFSGKLVL